MFINLTADRKSLALTFHFTPSIVEVVKKLPGRTFHPGTKRWLVPVEYGKEVLEALDPLGFVATNDAKRAIEVATAPLPIKKYAGKLPLYEFQKKGVDFMSNLPHSLLADVPGLGKTIQTIGALESCSRILVLCPASLKYSWEEEIKKWSTPIETAVNTTVIDGNKEDRKTLWNIRRKYTIANYDLLLHDFENIPKDWDAIVCDEATRISNPKTKTYKYLMLLAAGKKIALTGTPVSNTPEDLYGIVNWLRPGYLGTFWQFQDNYCVKEPKFHRIIGYKNLDDLATKVARLMLRRTKEEVLTDFPAKTIENIIFDLSDPEQKLYNNIRNQIVSELKLSENIDARTLGIIPVKMLRLKQATGHPSVITGEPEKSTKLDALLELLEPVIKSGEKAIIFTQFAQMANILLSQLNAYGPRIIDGSVPAEDRQKAVQQFTNDPECKVIIMTEAGAYGLNLQAASYVVHYDMPWSIAKLMQREDRAHRIGQKKPVTVYNLIARNTIDEYVAKVLHKKNKVSVKLLGDEGRLEDFGLTQEDVRLILRI
jgi:SNF2 family DNA or RNA helicase